MVELKTIQSLMRHVGDWAITVVALLAALLFVFGTLVATAKYNWPSLLLAVVYFAFAIAQGARELRVARAEHLPIRKALAIFSLVLIVGVGVFAAVSTGFLDPSTAPLWAGSEPEGRFVFYVAFYFVAFFDMLPGLQIVEALDLHEIMRPASSMAGILLVLFRVFVLFGLLGSFAVWRRSTGN